MTTPYNPRRLIELQTHVLVMLRDFQHRYSQRLQIPELRRRVNLLRRERVRFAQWTDRLAVQVAGHEHTCHITCENGPSSDHIALAEQRARQHRLQEEIDQAQQILETQYAYALRLAYPFPSNPPL